VTCINNHVLPTIPAPYPEASSLFSCALIKASRVVWRRPPMASVHLCICAFVHLCICAFVHLCICAFVHLCICVLCTGRSKVGDVFSQF